MLFELSLGSKEGALEISYHLPRERVEKASDLEGLENF